MDAAHARVRACERTATCFINAGEARHVAKQLGILDAESDGGARAYHEFTNRNHFFEPFPELLEEIAKRMQ